MTSGTNTKGEDTMDRIIQLLEREILALEYAEEFAIIEGVLNEKFNH